MKNNKNIVKEYKNFEGKTIKTMIQRRHSKYDDDGYLDIEFTDGTKICIVAIYYGYTGRSYDEYPTGFEIKEYGYEEKGYFER